MDTLQLTIHGISVAVKSKEPKFLDMLSFDFSYFVDTGSSNPAIRIEYLPEAAKIDLIPKIPETSRGKDYVAYDSGSIRYVVYQTGITIVHDRTSESASIYSVDLAAGYEKTYLLLLSRLGEHLERRGLFRVHGLGISDHGVGNLILAPSGGGKSTLALALLEQTSLCILSEDTPLLRNGALYPFPIRFAFSRAPSNIEEKYIRIFERRKLRDKVLIDTKAYQSRIEDSLIPLRKIFAARFTREDEPSIRAVGKVKILKYLIRDCVFGYGVPQVVEFFLQGISRDHIGKLSLVIRRLLQSIRAAASAKGYEFRLCPDTDKNVRCLTEFLRAR